MGWRFRQTDRFRGDLWTRSIIVAEVFPKLRQEGFVARANHMCCGSCAAYDLAAKLEQRIDKAKDPEKLKQKVKGCVFWHRQDEERWKEDGLLWLAFGSFELKKYGEIGLPTEEVGRRICQELEDHSIAYEWDGNPDRRILVFSLDRACAWPPKIKLPYFAMMHGAENAVALSKIYGVR